MEGERSFATRTLKVVGFGLLAFAITILAGGIWSGLVVANLQSTPAVPWSVPLMALLLFLETLLEFKFLFFPQLLEFLYLLLREKRFDPFVRRSHYLLKLLKHFLAG